MNCVIQSNFLVKCPPCGRQTAGFESNTVCTAVGGPLGNGGFPDLMRGGDYYWQGHPAADWALHAQPGALWLPAGVLWRPHSLRPPSPRSAARPGILLLSAGSGCSSKLPSACDCLACHGSQQILTRGVTSPDCSCRCIICWKVWQQLQYPSKVRYSSKV